ncbi:Dynamin-related GTPase protein [Savitreella phatthalungensis]
MSQSLEDLIPLVNKLQDLVFNTIGTDTIDLPQVVVVGSQSSGKSSVLENIVGRDFLPRGTGIVTRRPLILQLVNVAGGETQDEWAEFLHLPQKRYLDFDQVRAEIQQETSRIAGLNKGINRQPIHLKIYSPRVLHLTLVDLPGLTKIPVGDQPGDIERQVLALIREYIAKPNSIILAVSPANVDLVNSDGLKLARQVDPQGKRTIGVLTKLDLMDQGTNALDILTGRVYPLKLGFIGCVNRSQQDIVAGKPLNEALLDEERFFQTHPAYRNMSNKCGTPVLARALNTILMQHIRERLPDIKARLNTLIAQTQQELSSYGGPMEGEAHRGSTILQLMTRFATAFVASIDGTGPVVSTKQLSGGARIYHIFDQVFGRSLSLLDPINELSVSDIRTAIRNSTGPRAALFVPEQAFDLLIKPQIQLLADPSQRCLQLVYDELIKICHSCGGPELSRYPRLQMRLIEVVSELLRERLLPTSEYVNSLVDIQQAYINTNHPHFLGGAGAMSAVLHARSNSASSTAANVPGQQGRGHNIDFSSAPDLERNPTAERQLLDRTPTLPPRVAVQSVPAVVQTIDRPGAIGQAFGTDNQGQDGFLTYFFGGASGDQKNLPSVPTSLPLKSAAARSAVSPRGDTSGTSDLDTSYNHLNLGEPQLTDKERMETELIQKLIISYFSIVRETIGDQVPKAIMHLLVNHVKGNIQNRLVSVLYKSELFDSLLYEDEFVAQERDKCSKLLSVYSEANRIIQEVL